MKYLISIRDFVWQGHLWGYMAVLVFFSMTGGITVYGVTKNDTWVDCAVASYFLLPVLAWSLYAYGCIARNILFPAKGFLFALAIMWPSTTWLAVRLFPEPWMLWPTVISIIVWLWLVMILSRWVLNYSPPDRPPTYKKPLPNVLAFRRIAKKEQGRGQEKSAA